MKNIKYMLISTSVIFNLRLLKWIVISDCFNKSKISHLYWKLYNNSHVLLLHQEFSTSFLFDVGNKLSLILVGWQHAVYFFLVNCIHFYYQRGISMRISPFYLCGLVFARKKKYFPLFTRQSTSDSFNFIVLCIHLRS